MSAAELEALRAKPIQDEGFRAAAADLNAAIDEAATAAIGLRHAEATVKEADARLEKVRNQFWEFIETQAAAVGREP